ncbi:MAG: hypothetical protein A2W38_03785 [Deltaproteobacteria bacterium RBG_19FT_COMBO_58_16]|nr:MAG: hypothetical protein A2W38_03785 [Deltaproteobacteria bacterium RBG_19FT_COMBO_58_16]
MASAISSRTGFALLSSDRIRKELAGLSPQESAPAPFEQGIYSPSFTAKTYAGMINRGFSLLASGRPVILDATFSKRSLIRRAQEAAAGAGALFRLVECACSEDVARDRIEKRSAGQAAPVVSDADWSVYLKQKQSFESWDGPAARLDTARPLAVIISDIAREIFD